MQELGHVHAKSFNERRVAQLRLFVSFFCCESKDYSVYRFSRILVLIFFVVVLIRHPFCPTCNSCIFDSYFLHSITVENCPDDLSVNIKATKSFLDSEKSPTLHFYFYSTYSIQSHIFRANREVCMKDCKLLSFPKIFLHHVFKFCKRVKDVISCFVLQLDHLGFRPCAYSCSFQHLLIFANIAASAFKQKNLQSIVLIVVIFYLPWYLGGFFIPHILLFSLLQDMIFNNFQIIIL